MSISAHPGTTVEEAIAMLRDAEANGLEWTLSIHDPKASNSAILDAPIIIQEAPDASTGLLEREKAILDEINGIEARRKFKSLIADRVEYHPDAIGADVVFELKNGEKRYYGPKPEGKSIFGKLLASLFGG